MPAQRATGTRRQARPPHRRDRGTRRGRASSSSSSWPSSSSRPSLAAQSGARWDTRTTTLRHRLWAVEVVELEVMGARPRRGRRPSLPWAEGLGQRRRRAAQLLRQARVQVEEAEEVVVASVPSSTRRQQTPRRMLSLLLLPSPTRLLVPGRRDCAFATYMGDIGIHRLVRGRVASGRTVRADDPRSCNQPCTRYPFVCFILDGLQPIVSLFVLMLGYVATISFFSSFLTMSLRSLDHPTMILRWTCIFTFNHPMASSEKMLAKMVSLSPHLRNRRFRICEDAVQTRRPRTILGLQQLRERRAVRVSVIYLRHIVAEATCSVCLLLLIHLTMG